MSDLQPPRPPPGPAEDAASARPPRVLTAVPICDGHDSAVGTINRELVRAGVEVVYLGYNRPASMIARAAVQEDVAAVGISSYNGGHVEFFAEVRARLDALGGRRIKLFGGGGGTITAEDFAVMSRQGTDAVFMAGTPLDAITAHVVERYRPAVPDEPDADTLARCRDGDHEALGRLMSRVEAGGGAPDTSAAGNAPRVIGFSGPGGAGKSTLIDELLGRFLAANPGARAAVLTTDPSSAGSGGALLGDRTSLIHGNCPRVFYRSFASRGHAGGLAACVRAAVAALRGCGFDLVCVESLGTGQDADPFGGTGRFVDAAVYVMTPEYGSPVQLDKIAMLETADAVVLNKSDRPTARTALAEVARRVRRRGVPVLPTVACRHRDPGVDGVFERLLKKETGMGDLNRRELLAASGSAVAVSSWLAADAASAERVAGANARLNVAVIGCGGQGMYDVGSFLKDPAVHCVALADVDTARAEAGAEALEKRFLPAAKRTDHRKPERFQDYRKMLEGKDLDVTIVGTPDHWHALAAIHSMQAGKHVYCEKPLSHNIAEGRAMVEAAKAYKKVTQCGTQQRGGEHFRRAVKLVQDGALGKISICKTFIFNNASPDGIGNPPDSDAPATVDYDMWLGPAPKRPFNRNRFHYNYRWFFDYGSGLMCDWGVHLNDIILWGMNATAPKSVTAMGGKFVLADNRDTPDTTEVVYDFGGWILVFSTRFANQGGDASRRTHGMSFHGDKGNLFVDRGGFEITPEMGRGKDGKPAPRTEAVKSPGSDQHWPHVQEFLEAVRTNSPEKPLSRMEVCHRSTVTAHLGNIALKVGRRIYWDEAKEMCFSDPALTSPDKEANALLGREARKGFELPKIPSA
jgi:methylmalonyl-CoA mutase cobalamin-binding domain/chain